MRLSHISLAVLTALAPGCGDGPPGLDRVPRGSWGGDHVGLVVGEAGADAEFDCAHGRIEAPIRLDADGRFSARGVFVQEHGGPVRDGEPEDAHAAVYSGRTDGRRLSFVVAVADRAETVGPFTAFRGLPARVFKCL